MGATSHGLQWFMICLLSQLTLSFIHSTSRVISVKIFCVSAERLQLFQSGYFERIE